MYPPPMLFQKTALHRAAAVDILITRPSNDDVFLVGGVSVVFETRGFVPSVGTPIEVGETWHRAGGCKNHMYTFVGQSFL